MTRPPAASTSFCAAGVLLALALSWSTPSFARHESKREKADTAHQPEIAAAQRDAEAWLKIQDREDYDASWKTASAFFQKQVPQPAWTRRMNAVRKPLDPVVTRTLNTADFKTELPGLPRGVYVAFVWETIFSNGKPALESLIMTAEDGHWKMIGYAAQ